MFADLDPLHPSSTGRAFRALLDRKNCILKGQIPWSTAELRIASDDIRFLNQWLATGAVPALRSVLRPGSFTLDPLKGFSNPVICGALLHLLFAEHARRNGSEGNYWSCIRHLPWPDEVSSDWFGINGQPTSLHRSVLEQSAQALRLRNAFGIEGTFQWFSTGSLQFGFTSNGLNSRLPEWLASASFAPNAVVTLLNESKRQSHSFQILWSSLQDYRRGNISDAVARQRLSASPWVLQEWHDELLKIAKKRAYLGTGSHAAENGEASLNFLAEPRLRFDAENQPFFETALVGLADHDLTATAYQLNINDRHIACILRQPDGGYAATSTAAIILPWQTQTTTATLENAADATIVSSQNLTCWIADEMVQVFRHDGRRYPDADAFGARPTSPIWLLHPASLAYDGSTPLDEWVSPDSVWCLRRIDPTAHSVLSFESEIIWSLDEACEQTDSDREAFTKIRAWSDFTNPKSRTANLHISAESDVSIRWCRMGLEHIEVSPHGCVANVPITPEKLERGIQLHFGLHYAGHNIRHRLRVSIPFEGAVWYRSGNYHAKSLKVLNSRDGVQSRVRINPPGMQNAAASGDFALLEGNRVIRHLCNESFSPGQLAGLGAPLHVFRGPFNAEEHALEVAHAVIDGGLIHQVKISNELIKIIPMTGIELRPDFRFMVWVGGKDLPLRLESFEVIETTAGTENHSVWATPNLFLGQSINAVAILFEDSCVGWWWNLSGWTRALPSCPDGDTARTYASIIRILRCPVLFDDTKVWIQRWIEKFPSEVLSEWLVHQCKMPTPSGQVLHAVESSRESWLRAIGEIVEETKIVIDAKCANELLRCVEPAFELKDPGPSLLGSIVDLTLTSPWLAAETAKAWLASFADPAYGRSATLSILDYCIKHLAPEPQRIEDFYSNVLHIDDVFVDTHLQLFTHKWPHLPPTQKHNLKLLFQHDVIRRKAVTERLRAFQLP